MAGTDESERSWNDALVLANGNQFLMASFCLHLSIEKIIKANWVLYNSDNFPPRTHNLITILKETNIQTNNEVLILLEIINSWNIEGRYPDYKKSVSISSLSKIVRFAFRLLVHTF